jgi:hypothetical protein
MNKVTYVWKIAKDRWIRPYDDIIIRFNTKAENNDPFVWRIFVNGVENLATGFEINGYAHDVRSLDGEIVKYNVGCKGRVRWDGTRAVIITMKRDPDIFV